MKLIIYGPPRTKKNSAQLIGGGLHPRMIPSKAYREYEESAKSQLPVMQHPIEAPVNVRCVYYMQTRRKVDLTNLNSSLADILVRGGILADDNRDIIASMDGSRVYYDKHNPRVEVEITEITGEYEQWGQH